MLRNKVSDSFSDIQLFVEFQINEQILEHVVDAAEMSNRAIEAFIKCKFLLQMPCMIDG